MMNEKIDINSLSGIEQSIARKCDKNGDGFIKGKKENSLFETTKATINHGENTFIFEGFKYNADGSIFNYGKLIKTPEIKQKEIKLFAEPPKPLKIDDKIQELSLNKVDTKKLIDKWNKRFPKAHLTESFMNKLREVVEELHCKVSTKNFKPEKYNSPEEQAMDELCIMFALESSLSPRTRSDSGTFNGLFQLSKVGMSSIKDPKLPKLSMEQFRKLSAERQMDYLVGYIESAREASKLPADEQITPAQVWAMVKSPSSGKINTKTAISKQKIINQKR